MGSGGTLHGGDNMNEESVGHVSCSLWRRMLPKCWIVNNLILWLTIHCYTKHPLFLWLRLELLSAMWDAHRQKRQAYQIWWQMIHFEAILLRISNTTFFQRFSDFGVDNADIVGVPVISLLEWLRSILCDLICVVMRFYNVIQFLKCLSFLWY